MNSLKVQHYSVDGSLRFWVPISLCIVASSPTAAPIDATVLVTVLDRPSWTVEPFLIEHRPGVVALGEFTRDSPLSKLKLSSTNVTQAIPNTSATTIWYSFIIRPCQQLEMEDRAHEFVDYIRFNVSLLNLQGARLSLDYPALSEPPIVIGHYPVCYFDTYALSGAGYCLATTVSRSVPPELFSCLKQSDATSSSILMLQAGLDNVITDAIQARNFQPGLISFDHHLWNV